MAKKKGTRKSDATVDDTPQSHDEKATKLSRQSSMEEDHHEKVQNLKSLNAMLVKQTVEKRQQIDSLANAKTELETELARYGAERGEMRGELDQVRDENLGLRMELGLVMDYVGCRFREMGVGVERVVRDRDVIKGVFELQSEELNKLKESVVVLVEERMVREEERIEMEKAMEEKEEEIEGLRSEKNEMEIVKSDQRGEIEELERKLGEVSDAVESLRKEEKALRGVVVRLEKNLDESVEKERVMMVQIGVIGKEKMVKESELERLNKEKSSVEKQMVMVSVQCLDKEKLIDQLCREKVELEERVFSGEAKRVELSRKVDELERAVAALQKDCVDRTETNEKLQCKVGELRDALEQVEVEREEAGKALDEEKRHGEDLKADVSKSEKMIETTLVELEKVKIEQESLSTAKNDLEKQSKSLKSEKAILEKKLLELTKAIDALIESAGTDAKRSLVMLKRAASAVSHSDSEQQKQENGAESYALELESIEKAFKNKESIIEEMKKEAESMKQSTEEAHKKKSFWTVVSSVTTIFAAASFAYASRTR
ncbi:BnaC05g46670D [Brassica napus]|uniref:Uncharacterized protein n=2 Tax=Brassica TaxID=3705 RepID=A0A3P6FJR1_BRAOL|nr:cingulin-like [Brassica napus]CAF1938996.1 unnamed protein product [Brassica napus]CDY41937.1 BnaC05g46670D [Brassica napus]VDD47321.1 unnamed protein product [Brassica oleracea]